MLQGPLLLRPLHLSALSVPALQAEESWFRLSARPSAARVVELAGHSQKLLAWPVAWLVAQLEAWLEA